MRRVVVLDAGPLSMIANPKGKADAIRCQAWARDLLASSVLVVVPEIADYEVRRELIRKGAVASLARLDRLKIGFDYTPITTEVMLLAAELWAKVRQDGKPTADNKALDGDCILAAQALTVAQPGDLVIVATPNVGHLSRVPGIDAREWREILPTGD
jgi:predicted nucleic acid-binding protein